jgi:hypothetical protein
VGRIRYFKLYKTCNGCATGKRTYCYLGSGHSRKLSGIGNCESVDTKEEVIGKDEDGIPIKRIYYECDLGFRVKTVEKTTEEINKSQTPETCMFIPLEPCYKPKTFKDVGDNK